MNDDAAAGKSEIVIVRRRGGEDGGSHGHGAWKIAYADFVTAMMAFFLVMWLINASNEETRAQVASYFNPIKLTDNSTAARGLADPKDSKATPGSKEGSPPSKADVRHEAELMANPQKALDLIEKKPESGKESATGAMAIIVQEAPSTRDEGSNPGLGDPFDPNSWEKVPDAPVQVESQPHPAPASEEAADHNAALNAAPPAEGKAPEKEPAPEPENMTASGPDVSSSVPAPASDHDPATKPPAPEPAVDASEALKQAERAAREDIAAAIKDDIAKRLGTGLEDLPQSISVQSTDEGILISLTDKQSFGMFKTGSAEPEPELVRLVEAIAKALNDRAGYLVIRGHTDSRPYRNKRYDNWQLSSARAHFAQYMLIRGGLDEARIRRIEGVADRSPKNKEDPQAPENRRIEILLGLDGA